jgi:predicted PurR-regulated permease PerM
MAQSTGRERVAGVLFYGVVLLLGYLVFRVFQPFLVPLGWAAVIVVVFHPAHARLAARFGPTGGALASTAAVTAILIVPAILLMTAFVREGIEAVRAIQKGVAAGQFAFVERAWEWIQQQTPGEGPADIVTMVREAGERVANLLASKAGAVLRNVVLFVFDLVVTIFATFYLFRDGEKMMAAIRRTLPFEKPYREQMIHQARELIYASVTSGMIVAAVQGLLGGILFAAVGIGSPVFWGVVMGFFSLLPLVGPWLVWGPAAIWLLASGEFGRGLLLVGIGAGVVSMVDNFLRPALISGRAQLSGLVVFISVLGGIGVFGMLGVVLGPIVVATTYGVLEAYTRREEGQQTAAEIPTAGK